MTSTPSFVQPSSERFILDRRSAIPALIGNHKDFLFVTGLGNTSRDIASLTGDATHFFGIGGAMGAATMAGLGLALARPKDRVVVVTGDGELLMSVGSLAVVATQKPSNLAIVCVDNGHYGETGNQLSHTSMGIDLDQMARASGLRHVTTVIAEADIAEGARMLRQDEGPVFILLRVRVGESASFSRDLQPVYLRHRFRQGLLGKP